MDQFQAGGVNLVYFAACALPALWGHLRRGLVDRPTALWSIVTGVPACVAAAFFAASLDVTLRGILGIMHPFRAQKVPLVWLRRAFGALILYGGVRAVLAL